MIFQIVFLVGLLRARIEVARSREERDLGASAIEWAIIAAVSVVVAVLVGGTVYTIVKAKTDHLSNCNTDAAGTTTSTC